MKSDSIPFQPHVLAHSIKPQFDIVHAEQKVNGLAFKKFECAGW